MTPPSHSDQPVRASAASPSRRTTLVQRRPRPLRILILGGTAFLGIHMTEIARQRGHCVSLFNRGRTQPGLFEGVERLHGDRDGQLDALRGREWDAVIDNCGYIPRIVRMSAELLAPKVRHYLFISTISVYADFSKPNDERSAVAKLADEQAEDVRNAYGALKALCEKTLESVMPGRTTIIRPGLIVGPEDITDRFTYWPARALRGGETLVPGPPQASYQLIDVRDLARFCLDVLENAVTGVFNATSPAGMFTFGDLITESVAAAGALAEPGLKSKPTWVSPGFLEQQGIEPFVDLPGWVSPNGPMAALHHTHVDRALDVGLTISPLSRTTRDTLAWHIDRGSAHARPLRAGISPERERTLLALWHASKPNP